MQDRFYKKCSLKIVSMRVQRNDNKRTKLIIEKKIYAISLFHKIILKIASMGVHCNDKKKKTKTLKKILRKRVYT